MVLEDLGSTNRHVPQRGATRRPARCMPVTRSASTALLHRAVMPRIGPSIGTGRTPASNARATKTTTSSVRRCSSSPTAMGGAQAGEVLRDDGRVLRAARLLDGSSPGEDLKRHHREQPTARSTSAAAPVRAPRRRARRSPPRYVGERTVTIAHVGDSRCYLLARRRAARLTKDHSLVAGADRPREAHRGAGGDAPAARSGDHPRPGPGAERAGRRLRGARARRRPVHGLLGRPHRDGARAGRSSRCRPTRTRSLRRRSGALLIAAANDAGGRDNITIILFRPGGRAAELVARPAD